MTMPELNYITIEDTYAAILCELAAARLLQDRATMEELSSRLRELGFERPINAAVKIAAVARDAEREARPR